MTNARLKLLGLTLLIMLSVSVRAQIIRTIAGTGNLGYAFTGDGGPAVNADLGCPYATLVDTNGTIYFTDNTNHVIKKMTRNGILSTICGNGVPVYSGDGGPATAASIASPTAIIFDPAGNIVFGDGTNKLVRKISPSGIITTIAGNWSVHIVNGDGGPATAAGLGSVSGLAYDAAGNLYIADGNARVRKVNTAGIITTFAGTGALGFLGNGGPATAATFDGISDIAFDAAGNLYIADRNNYVVRKVNTAGVISVFAGMGPAFSGSTGDGGAATSARLNGTAGLKFDAAGNLYLTEQNVNKIRKVTPAGIISTFAGTISGGFSGDGGAPTAAKFYNPSQICFDSRGNVYIADRGSPGTSGNPWGRRIRQIFYVDTFHLTVTPSPVLCGNTAATFTAHPTKAYYSYVYRWAVNGVTVGGNSPVYASTTVHNQDTVTCSIIDTANGGMKLAISDTIIMTVLPPILPVLHLTNSGDTICAGLPITFTATATNGGSAPIFKWYVNSVYMWTGSMFSYIPVTGDFVTCVLISNDPCAFPNTTHIDVPLTVVPSYKPTITIHADPDTVLAYWSQIITLFSNLTYEGTAPTFQWYNNQGPIAGATNATYQQSMYGADTFYCVMHSNGYCAVPDIDTSNIVHISTGKLSVGDLTTESVSFSVYPNPNNGHFTLKGSVHDGAAGIVTIDIKNVLGQSVYKTAIYHSGNNIEQNLDLGPDLPSGMYYLMSGDARGNRVTPFLKK